MPVPDFGTLELTGPPEISGIAGTLSLPTPDWDEFMDGTLVDETIRFLREDGTEVNASALMLRNRFKFGYRVLADQMDAADIATLYDLLEEDYVTLKPRTQAVGETIAEDSFTVQWVDPVKTIANVAKGFAVTLSFLEIDQLDAPS